MLEPNIREQIIELIHRQVVPAVGCTEPMAVALCAARATELLGEKPEKVSVLLSANILKNAMGVGIPGTGMIGLPIAIALGVLIGKSDYRLEVIKDLTPESLEAGKRFIGEDRIDIKLKEGITEKLYIEVCCETAGHCATAVISGSHTNIVFEETDGKVLLDRLKPSAAAADTAQLCLDLRTVWEFATTAPVEEIDFILEAKRYNLRAAAEALLPLSSVLWYPGCGGGIEGKLRALPGEDHGPSAEPWHLREQHLFAHYSQDGFCLRCPHGRCPDSCDEQQRFRQSGYLCHQSGSRFRQGEREYAGRTHPCARPKSPYRHLHQTEPRCAVGPLRLCGGKYRFQLWHHLSDGR